MRDKAAFGTMIVCAVLVSRVVAGSARRTAPEHDPPAASERGSLFQVIRFDYEKEIAYFDVDIGLSQRIRHDQRPVRLFIVGADGRPFELELEPFEVFAPNARLVNKSAHGESELPQPDVVLLRGRVVDEPGSQVFLSLSLLGANGFIDSGGQTYFWSSGEHGSLQPTAFFKVGNGRSAVAIDTAFSCATESLKSPERLSVVRPLEVQVGFDEVATGAISGCRVADVAVDSDWEFTNALFAGNTAASSAYIITLLGAVSEIFTRDFGTRLRISYLRVWSTPNDPWTQAGASNQLTEFGNYWQANMTDVTRDTAHFLSGRFLIAGGGVAWQDGLCTPTQAYGLSSRLNGGFPYPLENNNPQNWDVHVVAHELGHNFGAIHTHQMVPPIDRCDILDCSVVPNATIMSYCDACPGGMANIRLEFHERTINEKALPFLTSVVTCDLSSDGPTIVPQTLDQTACVGEPVTLSVSVGGFPPITYQWHKDGEDVAGATGPSLALSSAQLADSGSYDVIVGDDCGTALSDATVLTVVVPPSLSASALGARYFGVTLAGSEYPVALRVDGEPSNPAVACISRYVQSDGRLDVAPDFRLPSEWGNATVSGAELLPDSDYSVGVDCGAAIVAIASIHTWKWGDADHSGIADVDDILAALDGYSGNFSGASLEALDFGGCSPNGVVDVDDLLAVLDAFSGVPPSCELICP